MTKAIQTTTPQKVVALRKFLGGQLRTLSDWLDSEKDAEALVRYTVMAFADDQKLQQCSHISIYKACVAAAYTGLKPDGKDAALVAYKGTCQLLPMYQGLMRLALQTGYVASLRSSVAHSGDVFTVSEGTNPSIDHRLSFLDDIGTPVAAYAVAKLANGESVAEVLRWSDVEKIRKAAKASRGPWIDWPLQMARKSAMKRLCKGLPMSGQFETALRIDNAVEAGDLLAYDKAVEPQAVIDAITDDASDDLDWGADIDVDAVTE